MVFREAANVIDEDYNVFNLHEWLRHSRHRQSVDKDFNVLRSIDNTFGIPDAVILRNFVQRKPRESVCTKNNILLRDLYQCQYCDASLFNGDATIDHVIPRSKGGSITWYNAATSCRDCNNKKGSKLLKDSNLRLKNKLTPLVWDHNYFTRYCKRYPNKIWEKFLGVKHG